MVSGGIDLVWM